MNTLTHSFTHTAVRPPLADEIVVVPAENGFRASRKSEPMRQFFGRTDSEARANLAAYIARWDAIGRSIAEFKAAGTW